MRDLRKTNKLTVRADASVYSLSGIARCADCGSTLRSFKGRGRVRLACNGRLKGGQCTQPSTFLDIYEEQLVAYLKAFSIPDDYQGKILEAHRKLDQAYDVKKQRATLESRLQKLTDLYEWGHKTKEKYLAEYAAVQRELQQLAPVESKKGMLEKLAIFLLDVASAWEQASQVQRNRLATCLLESVLIKDKKVVAVVPRPEFKPFFDLQYEGLSQGVLHWRPRGDLNPRSPP
ncbi:MAG: recombinase zinc beta ribbon domain-containing protein [Chloroflexi bacterium]|nr:recombinase zinc beta ribbon domain-containing protein [Chloroflexota bacterium]